MTTVLLMLLAVVIALAVENVVRHQEEPQKERVFSPTDTPIGDEIARRMGIEVPSPPFVFEHELLSNYRNERTK